MKIVKYHKKNNIQKVNDLEVLKVNDIEVLGELALAFFFRNLNQLGLTSFADFGTLLGLVRDGGFVANEKDIDIGIYGSNEEAIRTREFFINKGCQLWRQYSYGDKIVELSFIYWGSKNRKVKVDLNFYIVDYLKNTIKTYLFYHERNKKYFGNSADLVELNCTKPNNFFEIIFRNISIPIPNNATQILKEKYGEDWKKPNPNWIYWKSPSAIKQINKLGTYKNYPIIETDIEILEKNILELQKRQLKIIKFILKKCEEFKLTVMAAEGTLLGAIRNNGFIPWDENVDLMMPRNDYEILIKKIIKNPSLKFHLWNENTDKKYHLTFIKFVANDSGPFENVIPKDIERKFSGPSLNIYPVDEIFYSENIIPEIQNFLINIFRKALIAKRLKKLEGTFLKNLIPKLISFCPYKVLHKLKKESATFQSNFIFKYLLIFKKNKSKKSFLVNWMSSYNYKTEIVKTIDFKKTYILFEKNTKMPIPAGYDQILKKIYGDYMTPKKIRKSSHGIRYRVNKDFKI